MDEQTFNDDVTMGGFDASRPKPSFDDSERTINDERTMMDGSSSAGHPSVAEGTIGDERTFVSATGAHVTQKTSPIDEDLILAEIDNFVLLKKLGEGAAGKVYKACDRETNVYYAVKGLPVSVSETTRTHIKDNFKIVTKLNHPNIAAAKEYHVIRYASYKDGATAEDFQVKSGDALLVMEFAPGVTLAQWCRETETGTVAPNEALDVIRQVADALDEAHRQRIVHRDVKPANINIAKHENGSVCVKLLDFGIAAEGPVEGLAGTRTYMAPEQAEGKEQTAAVDIYALGKIARELLSGSPNGENDSSLDPAVRLVIERSLAVDPNARYKSGRDFYEDLETAILEGGIKMPPEYRELLRTFNSDELSPADKFDSYADALNDFVLSEVSRRKVTTQFTNPYDIYRFFFQDPIVLKHVDRLRSKRYRRRKNPSSVRIDHAKALVAFKAACDGVAYLSAEPIPDELKSICDSIIYPPDPPKVQRPSNLKSITLSITRLEDPYFYAADVDADDSDDELKVDPLNCGVSFTEFKKVFQVGDKVLITNPIESGDCWQGSELVLEPDFLLSPQALGRAHVWGQGSLMYLLSTFSREWKVVDGQQEDAKPPKYRLMLGNMGDDCLAEEVAGGLEPQEQLTQEFLEGNALDALAHEVDGKWREEAEFIRKNIAREIGINMPNEFGVQPSQWQIEAPFVSPILGVAGRMDAFAPHAATQGRSVVFELKSGKWKQFRGDYPKDEHLFQPWIYGDMLYYAFGIGREDVWPRLYYSKRVVDKNKNIFNGHSFAVTTGRDNIRAVVNFRNKVVNVWRMMRENRLKPYFDQRSKARRISALSFRSAGASDKLWDNWQKPQVDELINPLLNADPLASDYFWRFLAFEAAEDFCAWCGEGERQGGKSLSWKMSVPEKQQAGMVLSGLIPVSLKQDEKRRIIRVDFDHRAEPTNAFCSLRPGDSVFIYEQTSELSNPANSRVFGGHIESFEDRQHNPQLRVALDPPQTEEVYIHDPSRRYIIEASLGNRGKNEYKGLFMFLAGCPRRRQLLLNQIQPYCDPPQLLVSNIEHENDVVAGLVSRARAARDWFLVWGPPGTGKTSHLLRCYVEQVMATPEENVLMLAYTNRAVDEICGMLDKAGWDYWRIGTLSHCNPKYRSHIPGSESLLFTDRAALREAFDKIKIVVGTLASLNADHSILHLGKRFDSAIVDEASQILEPQLLSLFCAPDDGVPCEPLIGKFVLVGDDKQLPAVVQQPVETSAVTEESLCAIRLTNCRHSLFMRLKVLSQQKESLFGKMGFQFRMHEDIARFPNKYFYDNLGVGDSVRQTAPLPPAPFRATPFEKYVLSTRLGFFPLVAPEIAKNAKSNDAEAYVCAEIIRVLLEKGTKHSSGGIRVRLEPKDVGVITPFRSQIATIRARLENILPEPAMVKEIMIDTVERYQGSERSVIIFSAVVSKNSQLNTLSPSEDDERKIESDKKLNVALTRAKEQFFLIGDRRLLSGLPSYKAFIEEIESLYGAHCPKEPLAKFIEERKRVTESVVSAETAPEAQQMPEVAPQPASNNVPSPVPTPKKKSLWGLFLSFIGL